MAFNWNPRVTKCQLTCMFWDDTFCLGSCEALWKGWHGGESSPLAGSSQREPIIIITLIFYNWVLTIDEDWSFYLSWTFSMEFGWTFKKGLLQNEIKQKRFFQLTWRRNYGLWKKDTWRVRSHCMLRSPQAMSAFLYGQVFMNLE